MPRVCTICIHKQRDEIDRALIDGGAFRNIAQQFGVSPTALFRHKAEHLPEAMVKAAEAEDVAHAIDIVRQLKEINRASMAILADARKNKDGDLALRAVDRVQKQIELRAKLIGKLSDAPTVHVTLSSEWLTIRAKVVEALAPFPEARAALARTLATIEAGNGHIGA